MTNIEYYDEGHSSLLSRPYCQKGEERRKGRARRGEKGEERR